MRNEQTSGMIHIRIASPPTRQNGRGSSIGHFRLRDSGGARLIRRPGLIDEDSVRRRFRASGRPMAVPQLLVHDRKDTVGVVVIEGLKKGTDMLCVVTHDNSSSKLKSKRDVPIGHKVALVDIKKGDTIWKYGQDIGIAKAKIGKGEHVHVQDRKSTRW